MTKQIDMIQLVTLKQKLEYAQQVAEQDRKRLDKSLAEMHEAANALTAFIDDNMRAFERWLGLA